MNPIKEFASSPIIRGFFSLKTLFPSIPQSIRELMTPRTEECMYELDWIVDEWFNAFVAWLIVLLPVTFMLDLATNDVIAIPESWDILFAIVLCAWLLWMSVIGLFILAFVVKAWWRFFLFGLAFIVSLLFLEVALEVAVGYASSYSF